ncbi:MAG: AMP-binding protein, partial [Acidisphaera sp.]|nr:AMP-binding protein [Acidisphaera sp.]
MSAAVSNGHDYIQLELAEPNIRIDRRSNGDLLLKSPLPLGDYERQVGTYLRRWAEHDPTRKFLGERHDRGGWRFITYGEAAASANSVSQWLIENGHNSDRPVASLCENSVSLGVYKLGAMQVGIPYMPIAPSYLQNVAKLAYVLAEARPSALYVAPSPTMLEVLKQLDLDDVQIISEYDTGEIPGALSFAKLLTTQATSEVDTRFDSVTPDAPAKILLTSGSTGMPKGVINTHRMMCANGKSVDQLWRFLERATPVLVDWLPWSHTFGTNFNFNLVLRHGGVLYIDGGKPVPNGFEPTIRNLREVQPTGLHNVPRAFDMLIPVLESDERFARHVFANLSVIYYAGAALPSHLWHRIDALSLKCRGKRVPIFSAMGSTETGPVATLCYWPEMDSTSVGLPAPGCEIKLVPEGGKLEMRARGPNVTPGYYRRPDLTEKAFDSEGFFKLGDAVAFVDAARPEKGLRFDGRVAENFKLLSGTWVQV